MWPTWWPTFARWPKSSLTGALKRHRSLHPLSEHHHHVLVQALQVRRAGTIPPSRHAAALERVARSLVRFWKKTGQKHFREEEEVLLPAYARHVPLHQDEAVMRMLADHASIRAAFHELQAALAEHRLVEEGVAILGRMLHDHVRLEEEQVFPRIEATLSEAELLALAPRLTRLYRTKKG